MERIGYFVWYRPSEGSHGSQVIMGIEPLASALDRARVFGVVLVAQSSNQVSRVNFLPTLCCSGVTPLMSLTTVGSKMPKSTPSKLPDFRGPAAGWVPAVEVGEGLGV